MKLPRDLSAKDLIHALTKLGYTASHQPGSHIRLTTNDFGEHHITIPAHDPLQIGTLNSILADLCDHHHLNKEDLLQINLE